MEVALIGGGQTDVTHSLDEIGAKAYNLARMAALGLPVPPAFVLPVNLCDSIVAGDRTADQELDDGLRRGLTFLEQATGKQFGDRRRPLAPIGFGPVRGSAIDAGHDGHRARCRGGFSGCRRLGPNNGRSAVRLGLSRTLHRELCDSGRRS
jgi:hypothetical protein